MNRFAKTGEIADPYEQRWVMRSAGLSVLVRSASGLERCA
jgi:hypothetical protein